ncbi:MAG: TolB family protein, partial [Terriglobales bacterium]
YILSLDEKGEVRPFLNSAAYEGAPQFSPTGRYLAYVSDESGQREIYVTAYPGGGRKWQVSTQGGTHPVWIADGTQIFYRQGDAMMAASVREAGEFTVSKPRQLFRGNYSYGMGISMANYDVTRDGRRIVMVRDESSAQGSVQVALNWFEELRRLSAEAAK